MMMINRLLLAFESRFHIFSEVSFSIGYSGRRPRQEIQMLTILLFLRSPISHLPASSFTKGPSERLRRWREAASQAGLVSGHSHTTMRARRTILLCLSCQTMTIMIVNNYHTHFRTRDSWSCHTHFRTWPTWNCLLRPYQPKIAGSGPV